MAGQSRYRDLWKHYYSDTDAIVFVIDAADKMRACVVKDELGLLLENSGKSMICVCI